MLQSVAMPTNIQPSTAPLFCTSHKQTPCTKLASASININRLLMCAFPRAPCHCHRSATLITSLPRTCPASGDLSGPGLPRQRQHLLRCDSQLVLLQQVHKLMAGRAGSQAMTARHGGSSRIAQQAGRGTGWSSMECTLQAVASAQKVHCTRWLQCGRHEGGDAQAWLPSQLHQGCQQTCC